MGQFCNRDSIPIVTILPYKSKHSKRLNRQKKRRNFYGFLCIIHEQKSGVRPPEPFGSGLWDSVLEKSVVLFQQDRQCSFGFFILRRNIRAPVEIEHRFAISPQGDFRGSAFLISKNGRLLVMFHPVVKSARSYLNRSFCPHCFFLRFSLFLPFGMMYITINQRGSQRNFQHILHKDESRKLCMIPTQKASPTLPCVGRLWERGKPLGENKITPDRSSTVAVRAAAPFGALVLGYGFWITVRSGTPIQIRRRFRTPHRKGHRHRFPFP